MEMTNERTDTYERTVPYDIFSHYLETTKETEVPQFFSRWALLTALGAWLGREVWLKHGDFQVFPNMYVMLLGAPGTKKSTAIKKVKKLFKKAGYTSFAAEKTTKEKFLLDLAGEDLQTHDSIEDLLDAPLSSPGGEAVECFIAADEFNDFFGNNILDFVSLLGVLWDYEGIYESKIKNGQSVVLDNPYISILGGNTQTTFANTFPPEVTGQGFFSRLVAVYAEPTRKRITWPAGLEEKDEAALILHLYRMKESCKGRMTFSPDAMRLVDKVYKTWEPIQDERFSHYSNRRLNHLTKLMIVCACARLSTVIEAKDVTHANTILTHTEHYMPKAFGEYGRSRNSAASHKALYHIENWPGIITHEDMWKIMATELTDLSQLGDVIRNLLAAEKIQSVEGGFLPVKKPLDIRYDELVDYRYLTEEEIHGE